MTLRLHVIAFREAPDPACLDASLSAAGYRLYRQRDRAAWFLEGPVPDGEGISFCEPLGLTVRDAATEAALDAALDRLGAAADRDPARLDHEALRQAIWLSRETGLATLLVDCDDEGLDSAFLCAAGAVQDAVARTAPPADGTGAGMADLARGLAEQFWGRPDCWPVSSDPSDVDPADFELVAARGEAWQPALPGEALRDALWAAQTGPGSPAQRRRAVLALMQPSIAEAVSRAFIEATRAERDRVEADLSASRRHLASLPAGEQHRLRSLAGFLDRLLRHIHLLRPGPDFRQPVDFAASASRLARQWWVVRLRAQLG